MEFSEIVQKRYATKKFDGKKIEQKKIDELLELIRLSASSLNLQPWKIKVVSDQATKEKLLPLSWNQPQITTCSHLLVFCADTELEKKAAMLEKGMIAAGAKKDAIQGYLDMINGFVKGLAGEKRTSWAQRQTYLAVGNAINGSKSLGFDSCPMEGFDPQGYAKELKIPAHLVPTAIVTIGYAADTPHAKLRFRKEDVFI